MLIKDLVSIDEEAEFRNDVQLSDYEDLKRNSALLGSFLFTITAPMGLEPSLGLLRTVINAYLNPKLGNRIATIANYGHGKSHLALVLANYFGKPYSSTEMGVIQLKIGKVVDNPAKASLFREFRQSHPEFLVVRLRGDVPGSLREQFITCLEQTLQEHSVTRNIKLPFWHQKAENLLNSLSPVELENANRFLEQHSTDVPNLLEDVRQRSDKAYDLCRKLFADLHGIPPDFGGEVSLRDVVKWVAGKYCGEGKPLGGLLVLFDEFSLYIQRHAQRNAAGELQDLLNGIEDQEGRSVFLAFAQHDPMTVAQNMIKGAQGLESLTKELTRIPRKVTLYSLMESVINSYLKQPEIEWQDFRRDLRARGPLVRASNLTMELFSKRYEDALRWDTEKFDEIVTKGCFPLHPLTTALLCDLKLQGIAARGSNPRTVLGFIFNQVNDKKDQQAIVDTQINWVLPIALAEYFGDYIPENIYQLYENAQRNLSPDAPPEQHALLQALLLQVAARLPVGKDTQIQYLAEAAGISSIEQARYHMKQLTDARCIRFDSGTKMNSFFPVGADPHRLDEILEQRLEGKQFTREILVSLNSELAKPINIDVGWGHPEDWQAVETVLTQDFFEAKSLREFLPSFKTLPSGEFQEGPRGGVIWLLAWNEDEIVWFHQNAAKVLDEAFPGENPPPVVVMLPQNPCPELIEAFQKKKVLEKFSADDRHEVGIEIYDHEKGRLALRVISAMGTLRGDIVNFSAMPREPKSWIAPAPYRATLQALGKVSLYQALKECYRISYRYSPPEFFTQYKVSGLGHNKLREATRAVASVLLRNSLSSNREAITANPIARDLCEKFLWQRWRLISADYRIQEPVDQHILGGWNIFEQNFPGGVKDIRVSNVLLTLFNPPYGYDYNTILLLLCAWIGYHLHDLEISLHGSRAKMDDLAAILSEGGKKFIQQICISFPLGITRRDQGQRIREVKALIELANRDLFTQKEAQETITGLQSFCTDQDFNPELCESASQASKNLSAALELAKAYDEVAVEIIATVRDERNLGDLIGVQRKIAALPNLGNVKQTTPAPAELDISWRTKIESMIESECSRLQTIQRMAQIELHESRLEDLKKSLKKNRLTELAKRVDQALEIISGRTAELEAQEREAPILVEIRAMAIRAQLKTLYKYRQRLQQIDGYSPTIMQLREESLGAIEREIAQLETIAKGLITAIEGLSTLAATKDWQQQYLRQVDRYQGTIFQEELDTASEQVHHIQELLIEIEQISKSSPNTPEEAATAIKKLDKISSQAESWFGTNQKQLIVRARKEIDQNIQRKVAEGHKWFLSLEADLGKGAISIVVEKLKTPPAYLPESDKGSLESLQKRVRQQLEKDVVAHIETQFRQITNPAVRKQCLERLQQILEEK